MMRNIGTFFVISPFATICSPQVLPSARRTGTENGPPGFSPNGPNVYSRCIPSVPSIIGTDPPFLLDERRLRHAADHVEHCSVVAHCDSAELAVDLLLGLLGLLLPLDLLAVEVAGHLDGVRG